VAHLEAKAALLLVLMVLLLAGSVLYVLYARGVFEATQRLVLIAEDGEGVQVGMDVTFSGFPIGRVRRIELAPDGNARIVVDVPRKDAHWLRTSSVFTLVRNLVGATNIRAYSGVLTDPPLEDGAERKVLPGDATAEIPRLVTSTHELVQNLNRLTGPDSALFAALNSVQAAMKRLEGQHGALGLLFGNDEDARKFVTALERSNSLLARLDATIAKADRQVFGSDGLMPETRAAVAQLNAALGDARGTLGDVRTTLADVRGTLAKAGTLLDEAQGVAANARVATTDLGALRADVEASLRKVERLIDEINRKWPFARDTELKLK
jgi:phospholipid/cholesterol/gamma-HCH transport system substrate-binding protein